MSKHQRSIKFAALGNPRYSQTVRQFDRYALIRFFSQGSPIISWHGVVDRPAATITIVDREIIVPKLIQLLTQIGEDGLVAVLKLDDAVADAEDVKIGCAVCRVNLNQSALRDRDAVDDRDRGTPKRDGSDLEHVRRNRHQQAWIDSWSRQADDCAGEAGLAMKFANQIAGAADDGRCEKREPSHESNMAKADERADVCRARLLTGRQKHVELLATCVPLIVDSGL